MSKKTATLATPITSPPLLSPVVRLRHEHQKRTRHDVRHHPCWNQLDYTRSCISALLHHTRPRWELIVIDNGSTDGTAAYLADVRETAPLPSP